MGSSENKYDFLDPPSGSDGDLGTLGHYRVIDDLGKGGMGYVFLAEDTRLKREVALKVMNQKIAATPGSRKRFISEARSMAAVHHDNVATIFEVGEYKGTPFMAMELLEGNTLEKYRERSGEPDYHLLLQYARDIARGLGAAHAQGIVHRDIKPANIWLDTKTDRIKILDFGLALAQTPVDQLSGRGAVVGTPGYLSPEQARSEPLDDRSDLYSAGVVLYELATGALPLKSKTVAEQLIAILAHDPKPIRDRNDQIPQPLAEMIHRLMAKEPRDRYRSAAELEQALVEIEKECESKSEVAQAINQLQLGLEQAVKKKGKEIDDSLDPGAPDSVPLSAASPPPPNPFETLPDMATFAPAAPSPGVNGSGVHSAVPLSPTAVSQSGIHAAVPSRQGGSKARSGSANSGDSGGNTNLIWIIAGIAAAVLLVIIPAVVYFSTSSAIARKQGGPAVYIPSGEGAPSDSSSDGTDGQAPVAKSKQAPAAKSKQAAGSGAAPRPTQNRSTPPAASLMDGDTTLITTMAVKPFTGAADKGVRWILGNKNGNGSFETGSITPGQTSLPGWTLQVNGSDGGWKRDPKISQAEARTFAYAGAASEARLVSDLVNYRAQTGDRFRLSLNVGGEGQGQSEYRVVLGFRQDGKEPIRYQLARTKNAAPWAGGKQKKLRYEVEVGDAVKGSKPFLEILVSNLNSKRTRAMVDRISLTVLPASALASKSGQNNTGVTKPGTGTTPPTPMVASNAGRSASGSGQGGAPAETSGNNRGRGNPDPSDGASTNSAANVSQKPQAVRDETIKTSDEFGADSTVKRGAGQEPLGAKPALVIQTRKGRQIQHVYLRFPLTKFGGQPRNGNGGRNRGGGNEKRKPIPVVNATLKLNVVSVKDAGATVRLYGLNSGVSDVWSEEKLHWSRSLSSRSLEELPLLAEQRLEPGQKELVISNELLSRFVAGAGQNSLTFILTGSEGDELVNFASKENGGRVPPTLVLGLSE